MKVLLFTHEQDIDGMGSVILGQRAFKDFHYVTCKTFEINAKVQTFIDNLSIYDYDFIFVTDLCIKEPLLSYINQDPHLKNKLLVLDHHKTEIEEGNDKYDFVHITVSNAKGKASGTSLFYDYLLQHNLIKPTKALDDFVEWTRQYDTWEWKKYNNENGRRLHILFETLGYHKYIELATRMVSNDDKIVFSPSEEAIINDFNVKLSGDIKTILQDMMLYELKIDNNNYRIGYVFCPYKYRNDINEVIMQDNIHDIDMVGMIMTDTKTVSYRNVKDVDVSKVAVYFGGKGHKNAATNLQDNVAFKDVLDSLNNKKLLKRK